MQNLEGEVNKDITSRKIYHDRVGDYFKEVLEIMVGYIPVGIGTKIMYNKALSFSAAYKPVIEKYSGLIGDKMVKYGLAGGAIAFGFLTGYFFIKGVDDFYSERRKRRREGM